MANKAGKGRKAENAQIENEQKLRLYLFRMQLQNAKKQDNEKAKFSSKEGDRKEK